jgi:hypothetical protein
MNDMGERERESGCVNLLTFSTVYVCERDFGCFLSIQILQRRQRNCVCC